MTRDIEDRLRGFLLHHSAMEWFKANKQGTEETHKEHMDRAEEHVEGEVNEGLRIDRIALNMDQIEQYRPPPNPAKITDSRATAYIRKHGNQSWELDALDPDVLTNLIDGAIREYLDDDLWGECLTIQEDERKILLATSRQWEDVKNFVGGS